jgi:hypothetical protein
MSNSPHPAPSSEEILDESELALRLKTSVASIRWMRRAGRISFIKIAGNRKVRFRWTQVLEDLRAAEVRASSHDDERSRQLADIAASGDEDNAEVCRAELERHTFDRLNCHLPFEGKLTRSLLGWIPADSYIISLTCHADGSSVFIGKAGDQTQRHHLWAEIREARADQRNCLVTMDGNAAEVMERPYPSNADELEQALELRSAVLTGLTPQFEAESEHEV